MKRKIEIVILLVLFCVSTIYSQSFSLEDILEDIYNELSEEGEVPLEEVQEELLELASYPINLNQTTADELSKLRFLSDEQIDAILLYQYQHPFQDIYELQLIDCLKDYEIRNMLPFVEVKGEREKLKKALHFLFRIAFNAFVNYIFAFSVGLKIPLRSSFNHF